LTTGACSLNDHTPSGTEFMVRGPAKVLEYP
jgi:hypothetical protein